MLDLLISLRVDTKLVLLLKLNESFTDIVKNGAETWAFLMFQKSGMLSHKQWCISLLDSIRLFTFNR
jgi:hypothetical protein